MKKRIFSLFTALALCLGLLPGTAWAADGLVTITDNDGNSVALAAGNYYVINNTLGGAKGGVTEQIDPPTGKAYLTYDDGTLTVYGKEDESNVNIAGKMALSGDLDVTVDPTAKESVRLNLTWEGDSGPALALNGHTLTLGKDMTFRAQSDNQPAVDGGTIQFAAKTRDNVISLSSTGANAASGDLAVENAGQVYISGKPPVFEHLTVENCGNVMIGGQGLTASDAAQKITSSVPLMLMVNPTSPNDQLIMMPDHTVWADGGALSFGTHFIQQDVTTPTAYRAGEGWALYTPGEGGNPAKLTLDGASYNGRLTIQQADSVQLELKGENTFKEIGANAPLTLTGSGSFKGILYTSAFTNHSTGALNALVGVEIPNDHYYSNTVYGKYNTSDISGFYVTEQSPCTIAEGAVLTVDTENGILFDGLGSLTNNGTIINNSTIKITPGQDTADADISAFIKELKLTGTGTVTVENQDGTSTKYTNSGVRLLAPAGNLDLSADTDGDTDLWDDQGYKWENVETDESGNITSGTLTLAEGFNATEVILPGNGADVTVKTLGDSRIDELNYEGNTSSTSIHLTFEGGKLMIAQQVNFSGGNDSSVTVAEGAVVEANGGVSVTTSGVVDGTITVNGTLTSRVDSGSAIATGKVSVGPSGKLEVYGETGVQLGGINTASGGVDFAGAFSLAPGGRFTGDCEDYIILASKSNGAEFEADLEAEDIVVIPDGYLPQGCEPEFNEGRTSLTIPGGGPFNISSDNVPQLPDPDPVPTHVHRWAEAWTAGETHHWHECTAAGCPVRENSGKYGYEEHRYDDDQDTVCNVCGYRRTLTPSGGSSGRGSGGSPTLYDIVIEKSAHGKVTSSRTSAGTNSAVTLMVSPAGGYALDMLSVTDSQGAAVKLTAQSARRYLFAMPGRDVTVRAVFVPLSGGGQTPCDGGAECPSRSFSDLGGPGTWYHEAVDFVLEQGVMSGYGNGRFGPDNCLTRAQFAQILYHQAGRPAAGQPPFTDVAPEAWCAGAVAWAAEQGVVGGYGDGRFGPNDPVTREQLAAMLWRYAGSPEAGTELPFRDADQAGGYALGALRWAVETGVMSGKSGGVLDPKGLATRAQAAQMLANFLN